MTLRESSFPNTFVKGIHAVGWVLIFPCFWYLDRLIAVCKSTTLEQTRRKEQKCYLRLLEVFFGSIFFFSFFVLTAPLALLGLLLWAPVQACRRPFSYHREAPLSLESESRGVFETGGQASFTFATANLCFLPDGLARFNNLSHTLDRASSVGRLVVKSQEGREGAPQDSLRQNPPRRSEGPWEVETLFPASLDVLCLVEVFDKRAAQKLTDTLKPVFGHILFDVGVYACQPPCRCSSFKFFNSGVFLASRFPVMEAQYRWFPNSRGEDALAAKGLLCTKLLLGQSQAGKKVVGYFNCTHLHAPEGDGEIRCEQLDMITQWLADFQAAHKQPEEEVVFDTLCGDFNFDNCSPDDTLEQHHALFEEYRDPCRAGPGKEKPWVIGTLLEQPTLYEDDVKTPDSLKRTLETEELRKKYISPPVAAEGFPLVYPEDDQPWVGRRIDYILYRDSSISKPYKTEVEAVTYVTQLAGLTDHIPVGLRLNVTVDSNRIDV
ncbi:sphingomyelin phosphodiesterase 5 [Kryptolebias marmoratus]|uniref:sphingomyelin phosphodiesterase n=1 Tax=Kryptolebias marmoratus TaxID=37003 RepID=A0A3Q3B5W0_KRYMA|nr:sphingomyelin phosphodiesterase 5 [Kryptolebias marmoratus]XP_037836293.1 sphingomyelin phosphodiesterase 5 [Kryptolebias marmoratus]